MRALAAALVLVGAAAGVARAGDPAKADDKFKLGKKLLAQKHYAEACKAFEDSNTLDPNIGALLNVGHCYEEWGKLATAYRAYESAETMAKAAHDGRVPKIRERIDALDPQVPRLTLEVAKDADTAKLVVTLDGQPVATKELGVEMRVDPGPHRLEYRVGDAPPRDKTIPLERGGASDITLELPKAGAGAVAATPATKPEPDEPRGAPLPGHGRRIGAVVAIGAGTIGMGIAVGMTVSARSRYRDALDAHCGGDDATCDPAGLKTTHDARHEANVASVVFGVGAAVAVAGIVLYVTAPHARARERDALRVVPVASPDGAGLVVLGRF